MEVTRKRYLWSGMFVVGALGLLNMFTPVHLKNALIHRRADIDDFKFLKIIRLKLEKNNRGGKAHHTIPSLYQKKN